jgi:AbrB family transcriptional regulator (stage V sporulation protein T)
MRIREGDPMEIFVNREGEIILKKYSLIKELGDFAIEYAESLYEATGHIAIITDRDQTITVAGASKKEFLHKSVGAGVDKAMNDRRPMLQNQPGTALAAAICEGDEREGKYSAVVIAPIVAEGDPIGAVALASQEANQKFNDVELRLVETGAAFLAKQMEQ